MAVWEYIKTREFRKIALTLFGAFVLLYLTVFLLILPIFTKHGDEAKVPNITGLLLNKAEGMIDAADLDYEVTDSIYSLDGEPLMVVKQFPLPGSKVKPGRKVLLTVNKKQPPMVKMPKLADKSLYQTKTILRSWKLRLGEIKYVPGDADAADEVVLRAMYNGRKLEGGEDITQGSKIDLYISQGIQNTKVAVPNLVGMTYDVAEAVLRLRDLGVGGQVYDESRPAGKIFDQNPRPAERDSVKAGTAIDLYIGGKAPESNEAFEGGE